MPSIDPLLAPETGGAELYLIRHGHAVPSADAILPGNYDDQPLSELGRRQAHAMAERFRTIPLVAIYSSPIRRASETAEALGQVCDLPVTSEVDLREVDLTQVRPVAMEGLPPAEHAAQLAAYLKQIEALALQVGVWSEIPGVEPSEAVRRRVVGALHAIAARHAGQRVAVVSHNGAINAGIAALLGLPRDFFFPAANTSISVVRLQGEQSLVVTLNDYAHLASLANAPSVAGEPAPPLRLPPRRRIRLWPL